jgi:hypothetical protein
MKNKWTPNDELILHGERFAAPIVKLRAAYGRKYMTLYRSHNLSSDEAAYLLDHAIAEANNLVVALEQNKLRLVGWHRSHEGPTKAY